MGRKVENQRCQVATLKKQEVKVSAEPASRTDLTPAESSVDASTTPGAGKPNLHSTQCSTITAQAQAGSALGQTCSLRPRSTLAAVSSNRSAGNTPVLVTTPDPPDVDSKPKGRSVCLEAQAAVKYLVSQVETFDTSEHEGSDVSIAGNNDSKRSNRSGNDSSSADENNLEEEGMVVDKGHVGSRVAKSNVMGGNSAGIIVSMGRKNARGKVAVPVKKVVNCKDEFSSEFDLDDGKCSYCLSL